MFTGLQSGAGWRPAETMGLENGVCLCVPLLSQREARQLSTLSLPLSLPLSISLSRRLCFFGSIPSFFCFLTPECIPFISFCPSRNLFSALSPPRAYRPDVFPPRFLSVLFSLSSSFLLLLFVFPDVTWLLSLFTPLTPPRPISITDKVCVKLEVVTRY